MIGEVFGTPNHKVMKSISSLGKSIFVDFKKQDYWGTVEFVAIIKYNKINSDCQSWLDNHLLISPNNPNTNCSWIITKKFGSYITLDFKFIEVKPIDITVILNSNYIFCQQIESGFDSLKVYDGGSKYADMIKIMTGVYKNTEVSIPRNQMFVTFETTSMVSGRGFTASVLDNSN